MCHETLARGSHRFYNAYTRCSSLTSRAAYLHRKSGRPRAFHTHLVMPNCDRLALERDCRPEPPEYRSLMACRLKDTPVRHSSWSALLIFFSADNNRVSILGRSGFALSVVASAAASACLQSFALSCELSAKLSHELS